MRPHFPLALNSSPGVVWFGLVWFGLVWFGYSKGARVNGPSMVGNRGRKDEGTTHVAVRSDDRQRGQRDTTGREDWAQQQCSSFSGLLLVGDTVSMLRRTASEELEVPKV